tara:strand:+ start:313 stop:492 length:180 start_codon:yes stop_codon:yes gene_type:complete
MSNNKGDEKIESLMGFKCRDCGKLLDLGLCGDHKGETGHSEFDALYGDKNNEEMKGGNN